MIHRKITRKAVIVYYGTDLEHSYQDDFNDEC